jgi:hypothetical protein
MVFSVCFRSKPFVSVFQPLMLELATQPPAQTEHQRLNCRNERKKTETDGLSVVVVPICVAVLCVSLRSPRLCVDLLLLLLLPLQLACASRAFSNVSS